MWSLPRLPGLPGLSVSLAPRSPGFPPAFLTSWPPGAVGAPIQNGRGGTSIAPVPLASWLSGTVNGLIQNEGAIHQSLPSCLPGFLASRRCERTTTTGQSKRYFTFVLACLAICLFGLRRAAQLNIAASMDWAGSPSGPPSEISLRRVAPHVWYAMCEIRCVGCDVLDAMCGSRRMGYWVGGTMCGLRSAGGDVWDTICI